MATTDLIISNVEADRVGLTATLQEIPLVELETAPAPSSVHQFLVVVYSHFFGVDFPRFMAHYFWWILAVSAVARPSLHWGIWSSHLVTVQVCFILRFH